MAGPLTTALLTVGKSIIADITSEPENILKYVLIVIGILLFAVFLLLLPLSLLLNFPLLSFDSSEQSIRDAKQKAIAIYRDAPAAADEKISAWVDDVKNSNTYDDCSVSVNFSLDWRLLMIIDAVRLQQDFSKVNKRAANDIAFSFADKDYYETTYEDTVTSFVIKRDSSGKIILDENGVAVVDAVTETVTGTRLNISVSMYSFEDILNDLNFSQKDYDAALLMYENLKFLNADGELLLDGGA